MKNGAKMKVRVIKEMPFAKVGEILELEHGISFEWNKNHHSISYEMLIGMDWLEEVKEESLEDKLRNGINRLGVGATAPVIAKMANDHYKQEVLEAFDGIAHGKPICLGGNLSDTASSLSRFVKDQRKALEKVFEEKK